MAAACIRTRAALAALVCALAAAPAAAQSMVQPLPQTPVTDPRTDPRAFPVSAVGKLNVVTGPGSRQHCTATLIGRRHALTAAHCLYDRARRTWVDPRVVHFVAGYAQGTYTAHAVGRAYTKPDAYRPGTDRENFSRDWAVIELAADIPLRPVKVAAGERAAFTGLLHAGYKGFSDQIVTVETGCAAQLEPAGPALLGHLCRVVPGESGSALIDFSGAEPEVVGVLVASSLTGATPSLAVPAAAFRSAAEAARAAER